MDLKVSGSSLTQGMKGFSYVWDLFSGVTQACLRPSSDGIGRSVGMQKKYMKNVENSWKSVDNSKVKLELARQHYHM